MVCGVSTHQAISDILLHRSSQQPNQIAYRFLADDGIQSSEITYRELDEGARRVAAWLQSRGISEQPVPLIFTAGLDFVRALYGCLYAGNSVVPLSLPSLSEGTNRVLTALADVNSSVVLVSDAVKERLRRELQKQSERPAFEVVSISEVTEDDLRWREPRSDPGRLALLQYTSGSTSNPKGVEISHNNLLHSIGLMALASRASEESIGVSWLPHFHDMGLIGGILMPLCVGFPVTLMSPSSFIRRPLRWLETISNLRATVSGAPNFGYEHCLREIERDDLHSINLSSWSTAYSGAEPIRAETIARFCAKFGDAGFRKGALFPCYGLAEATLMVSGQHWSNCSEQKFSRSLLESGCVQEAGDDNDCTTLVGSGSVLEGHRVLIVDAESRNICDAGAVGEVWINSASVGKGYWNRPDESMEVFAARLNGLDDEQFLRTGDLGFLWRGQLFITGRQKDLLIIRGANFYPQDIEHALEAAIPSLRAGYGAAFTIDEDQEEKLVLIYELDKAPEQEASAEFDAMVATVAKEFGLQVCAIALIKRNRIPRTTSGKIKRQQCRSDFIGGRLSIVAEWWNPARFQRTIPDLDAPGFRSSGDADVEETVRAVFKTHLAELLGVKLNLIADSQSIYDLGIDSLVAAQLQNRIEQSLKIRLDVAKVLHDGTIGPIILELVDKVNDRARQQSVDVIGDVFERVLHLSDDEVAHLLSLEDSLELRGQP